MRQEYVLPFQCQAALIDVQKLLGALQAEPDGGKTCVIARLDVGGKVYHGLNGHGQSYQRPSGVTPCSAGHAEADVAGQAARDRVSGGTGSLYVAGKIPCPFCKSSMAGWARELNLDELNVYGPNGYIGRYLRESGRYRTICWGINPRGGRRRQQ